MNYRHAFHAGNPADCLKHAVLALLIEALKGKDKPFMVLDTHAGAGRYDLSGDQASKTGEWVDGIARLVKATDPPEALRPYLGLVRAMNPGPLRWYPGSPAIATALSRPIDRLEFRELHREDAETLAATVAGDPRARVRREDGYIAVKALLPPPERRGLTLIDPPFERRDEFAAMARALAQALKRFSTGVHCLWYPIKDEAAVADFHAALPALSEEKALIAELHFDRPGQLAGAGLVIVNPPWRLDGQLRSLLPYLVKVLGGPAARWRLSPLAPSP